jgi:uncharacterized protein involved in tolerance to divalent cations
MKRTMATTCACSITNFVYFWWSGERAKMENAPAIKTNEANLEELNKKIVEIKRKIVLKGEAINCLPSI